MLHGVVERDLRTLGFALTLIERSWADAQLPIDGGVMEIKQVDAHLRATFRAGGGNESDVAKTAKALNMSGGFAAVWIATPVALYYVIPAMGATQRWPWSDIQVREIKKGKRFARLGLLPNESGHEFEARLAAWPAENLLSIADFYQDVERQMLEGAECPNGADNRRSGRPSIGIRSPNCRSVARLTRSASAKIALVVRVVRVIVVMAAAVSGHVRGVRCTRQRR